MLVITCSQSPDRAGIVTCEDGGTAQVELARVVQGCPLGTIQDRCEWHSCGTAGEEGMAGEDDCSSGLECDDFSWAMAEARSW
jgi:hypothetical protein